MVTLQSHNSFKTILRKKKLPYDFVDATVLKLDVSKGKKLRIKVQLYKMFNPNEEVITPLGMGPQRFGDFGMTTHVRSHDTDERCERWVLSVHCVGRVEHSFELAEEAIRAFDRFGESSVDQCLHVLVHSEIKVEFRTEVVIERARSNAHLCGEPAVGRGVVTPGGERDPRNIENAATSVA